MSGYQYVIIMARGPDGKPKPAELSANHCLRIIPEAQALTLVQSVVALSTTAIDIGTEEDREAVGGWELISTAAWLVGDAEGQERPVAPNEPWSPPSASLAGVWAKAASGTLDLIITGGVRS